MAARILKVGKSRVWFSPEHRKEIEEAITARDFRALIKKGIIRKLPSKENLSMRKGKRKGPGRRKGAKYSRLDRKRRWIIKIRALRRELKRLKEENLIEKENCGFYILNTSTPETDIGVVGRTTRNRLMRYVYHTKNEYSDKFHTVVMHHHIVPIPGTRETSALEDAGDVLHVLTEVGVNLVLTGHMGKAFCTRVEKTVFANCNTLASSKTSSLENSFNVIDVSPEGAIVVSEVNIPSGFRRILGIFPGLEQR